MGYPHLLTIMVLYRFIIIVDGVISVMTIAMIILKLMSFVISWDTLELQVTLELGEQVTELILIK